MLNQYVKALQLVVEMTLHSENLIDLIPERISCADFMKFKSFADVETNRFSAL